MPWKYVLEHVFEYVLEHVFEFVLENVFEYVLVLCLRECLTKYPGSMSWYNVFVNVLGVCLGIMSS